MISSFLVSVVASAGIVQGFCVSIYLLLKRTNRNGDVFLGVALLGLTLRILKSVLNYHLSLGPIISSLGLSGIFLTGPFLFFYAKSLLYKSKIGKGEVLHLVPFIAYMILIPFVSDLFHRYINYYLAVTHLGIYLAVIFSYLIQDRGVVSRPIITWLFKIVIGTSIVWVFYLLNLFDSGLHYLSSPLQYCFVVYWFTFLFLNRKYPVSKYNSSQLSKRESSELFHKLIALIERDQVYLTDEVSISSVARQMDMKPRELSQVINENAGKNFKALLNDYRIKKAKHLLRSKAYAGEKIATIAYESGFNNVTSFNLAFKKITGSTPSEFRNPVLN